MTTPTNPTTPPASPVVPGQAPPLDPAVATTDGVLAERAQNSGEYLAGLLADGMLDSAGTPTKLPHLRFAHLEPWDVEAIWQAALAVGFRAGRLSAQSRWVPETLDNARTVLQAAGFEAMGRLAGRSRNIHPPRHPADTETPDPIETRGTHPEAW